ncbi:two-component system response regulator [Desulfuromonas acetoxidans]|uniref:Response regulator receiver modulated metal dependent phosphohydrolase n=1 Tax=Desulfuromonas acetoxidans (strain DSM 684 / 11070) TaxID=281689 RepID=Q1JX55_DESA6|nr:two-component system response regulator [Desulfuromonas acetoxidans]EAT14807.1 response regulator receiver modulated metal dependent phosphohydrolase [Desulfuromonas acetoxidans DSM 684]
MQTGQKKIDQMLKTILVVDDIRENLEVIGGVLQSDYRVRVANSGQRAIKAAASEPRPDLILLDVMMPEMDGYAVLRELKANPATKEIPVIFVTAMDSDQDEEFGLALGAVDYVTKPIRPAILLARAQTQLELKESRDRLQNQNTWLEEEVRRRMAENELIKDVTLYALASLAEVRDQETGYHLQRTQTYLVLIMEQLKDHPRFQAELSESDRQLIAKAAPLHDIGKVGIPDEILLKPARLTPDEFEIMKTHSKIGGDALAKAAQRVLDAHPDDKKDAESQGSLIFLDIACKIAMHHHERWDGTGYPDNLAGEDIPIPARLMTLVDVFDALSCKRPYKEPFPMEETIAIIREERGKQFDPDVVDAFVVLQDQFVAIANEFANTEE